MKHIHVLTVLYPEAAVSPGAPASSSLLPPSARCSATDQSSKVNHHHHHTSSHIIIIITHQQIKTLYMNICYDTADSVIAAGGQQQ